MNCLMMFLLSHWFLPKVIGTSHFNVIAYPVVKAYKHLCVSPIIISSYGFKMNALNTRFVCLVAKLLPPLTLRTHYIISVLALTAPHFTLQHQSPHFPQIFSTVDCLKSNPGLFHKTAFGP